MVLLEGKSASPNPGCRIIGGRTTTVSFLTYRHVTRRGTTTFLCLAAVICVLPSSAEGQWALGRSGRIWIKTAAYWQKTDEEFNPVGQRGNYIGEGESDARALYTDIIIGLHKNVDLWLQIPFFDLRYNEIFQDLRSVGFGDIRAWVRWQFLSLNGGQTPVAIRAGVKAPVGDSPLDAQIVPVGEGQWDVEFYGEVGHSFWPAPFYAELWLGYRVRFAEPEGRDPGGEYLYLAEAGVQPTSSTLLKVTMDGFTGRKWTSLGYQTGTRRRVTSVQFAGAFRAGSLWPEFGVRLPLTARGFPAGLQYILGFSTNLN